MHHLSKARPESRKAGSFEGKVKFVATNFYAVFLIICCVFTAGRAMADGDVSTCNEGALLLALQGGGLVTFSEDCEITLSQPIVITNDVTIDASDFDVTLHGDGSSQLFIVQENGSLELIHLTVTGGAGTNGGALLVNSGGSATITDCSFIGNSATGAAGTNGVNGKASSGTAGNGTRGSAGGGGWGGAIFNAGDMTITTSTFTTNSANGGDGGNGGNGGAGGLQGGSGGSGGAGGIALGGAIYNDFGATLSIEDCTFEDNQANGGSGGTGGTGGSGSFSGLAASGGAGAAGSGAGVYSLGDITISGCTFDSNIGLGGNSQAAGTATSGNGNNGAKGGDSLGGGIFLAGANQVTNCTFFGNKVTGGNGGNGGPGNYNAGNGGNGGNGSGGGTYNTGDSQIVNCTFASCGAAGGTNGLAGTGAFPGSNGNPGRGRGGDLANGGGTLTLFNTILSTNLSGGNITNIAGSFVDGGHNLSSDASYHFTTGTNIAPKLGPLADNGGPTFTMALLINSPARDAGDDAAAPNVDQRGFERPMGSHSDIGAYEYGFTVSGQVFSGSNGVPGISIHAGSITATTDSTGSYQVSAVGAVTITPVNTNYIFNPPSTDLNVVSDVDGIDFEAVQKFSISGNIVGVNGPATVTLGTNTITTTNGAYSFGGLSGGTYTVTPSAAGVSFSPPSVTLNLTTSTNGLDFFALFQISGQVFNGSNGLAGVTVRYDTNSAVTDANGNYTLTGVRAGSNSVYATLSGYTFSPPQSVTVGPSTNGVDFTVTGFSFNVSGRVTFGTNGLANVVIFGSRTTDASGFYSLNINSDQVTLTPKLRPYSFLPASVTLQLTNNVTNVNFVAGGVISSIAVSNDGTHLGVFGPAGTLRIQASTNLSDWVSIYTNSSGGFGFTDHDATNFTMRFYRTVQP